MKGTLKREKTKSNNNLFNSGENETTSRPSSRGVLAKPDLDFAATVDKGKRIKEGIRKRFSETFNDAKLAKEAGYSREILQASLATPMAFRRGGLSLGHGSDLIEGHVALGTSFTEADSFVSTKDRVSIFPIADEKLFPPRSRAVGWEIGLRSYPNKDHGKVNISDKGPDSEGKSDDDHSLTSKGSAKSLKSFRSGRSTDSDKSKLIAQTFLSEINKPVTEKKLFSQTLPDPSDDEKDKYFGNDAKERFYATYQQLNRQADMFLERYDTLQTIITDGNNDSNLLTASYNTLRETGVLSPRKVYSALELSSMSMHSSPAKSPPKSAMRSSKKPKRSVNLPSLEIDEPDDDHSISSVHFTFNASADSAAKRSKGPNPKLEVPLEDDQAGILTYNLNSPRAVFLSGCLKHSLPPRAQVLLRKTQSTTINLAHMGIGNQMAIILAECIHQLPYLQVLNLSDNNLEDSGLSALLRSIKKHPTIEHLDISQNTIDDDAATALADLIGNEDCKLQSLKLSDADINDSECARFVQVLMHNRHLKELDMSKNLLGKDENLNVVQPDFETGGESLAKLLQTGLCPIRTLNLHWNMIRMEGAEVLCDSIRNNMHLVSLDLSYNALGRSAASVLGAALFENSVIETINIANNGIDAIGSFTLFVGLRENKSVRSLVIDGNPIGEQGARMLMKVAASEGHRLEISAKNCDFTMRGPDVKFSISDPIGDHLLQLDRPYDRAILIELLYIIASDANIDVVHFEYTDTGSDSTDALSMPSGLYNVVKFEEPNSDLYLDEETELSMLKSFTPILDMSPHDLRKLARGQDHKRIGGFGIAGLKTILNSLQIKNVHKVVGQIAFTLDPFKTGIIETNDFVEFLYFRTQTIKQRIWQLQHLPKCAVIPAGSPTTTPQARTAFFPPKRGVVKMRVIDSYDISHEHAMKSYPLSGAKCQQVIKIANMSSNPVLLLTYATESTTLYLEEAQRIYNELLVKSDDPTPLLARLILRMANSLDAMRMIRCFVGDDVLKIRRLKQKLGYAYYPLIGIYSGYYILDLTKDLDRICLKKLIEQGSSNIERRRRHGLHDTSQHGHWTCFRNEMHYDASAPAAHAAAPPSNNAAAGNAKSAAKDAANAENNNAANSSSRFISPKNFYPVPHHGKVECDFVNIHRPHVLYCRAASDEKLLDCLLLSRLLPEDRIDWATKRLSDMALAIRRSFLSNGAPIYKPEYGTAVTIGEQLHIMYGKLADRREARTKALKRELIKSAIIEKKVEKKKAEVKVPAGRTSYYSSPASVKKSNATASAKANLKTASAESTGVDGAAAATVAASGTATPPASMESVDKKQADKTLSAFNLKLQQKIKEAASKFKTSIQLTTKAERLQKMWGHRMYEAVVESTGSDEYKSAAVLEFFESELVPLWLYCKHVALVIECFAPFGLANRSNMGSYRVELLVMLFDRILDLQNFDLVLMMLNAEEQAALYARIGVLNLFNPSKPEGARAFDLTRWEERQMVKMFVHLSVSEPGDNWLNKQFIFDRGFAPIPGWDLSVTWLSDEGLPKKGLLCFEFYAGAGMQLYGCKVDIRLRQILSSLVLVGQEDYLADIHRGDMLDTEVLYPEYRPDSRAAGDASAGTEEGAPTPPPAQAFLFKSPPDYVRQVRPLRALEKLNFQIDAICKINDYSDLALDGFESQSSVHKDSITTWSKQPKMKMYVAEDANRHLVDTTDITWNYLDNVNKYETWLISE